VKYIAIIVLMGFLVGCVHTQVVDKISQVEEVITSVADGSVGTTITTVGTGVASFLPPPWGQGLIALVGLFGWIRGRKYKKAVHAVVEGVGEVLGGMDDDAAKEAKGTLKRVATEHNMKKEINAIVDKINDG